MLHFSMSSPESTKRMSHHPSFLGYNLYYVSCIHVCKMQCKIRTCLLKATFCCWGKLGCRQENTTKMPRCSSPVTILRCYPACPGMSLCCWETSSQWLWVLGEDDEQGMCDFGALIVAREATGLHVIFAELYQRIRMVWVLLSVGRIRRPAAQVSNLHTNKNCHC